jgi:hypothetical protein
MQDKVKKVSKKTAKKDKKTVAEPEINNPDNLHKAVLEISLDRKSEIEENPELSKAICALANQASDSFMDFVKPLIQTGDETVIKKDTLLVLQLMYLKLSSELMEKGKNIELSSEIKTSGYTGVKPIDTKDNNVPIYL